MGSGVSNPGLYCKLTHTHTHNTLRLIHLTCPFSSLLYLKQSHSVVQGDLELTVYPRLALNC